MNHPAITHTDTKVRLMGPPTYWRCEPEWSWRAAPLPHFLVWHVLEGVGHMKLGAREHQLRPGFCAVFAPGDTPVAHHDPTRPLLVFGIHFGVTDSRRRQLPTAEITPQERWTQLRDQTSAAMLAELADRGYRAADQLGTRQAELSLTQLICLLWNDFQRQPPDQVESALEQLTRVIRREPGRHWTVATLAEHVNLSRAQFTRRFTAHTGTSPARYLARARMHRAEQLLCDTDLPVGRIAAILGFDDVTYFSRQFKRHTGSAPSVVRTTRRQPTRPPVIDETGHR